MIKKIKINSHARLLNKLFRKLNDSKIENTDSESPVEVEILSLVEKIERLRLMGYFGQSALGDDYTAITLRPKGVPDSKFGDLYMETEGWEVAWHKSLTTPLSSEYLREQIIPGYVIEIRQTNEDHFGEIRHYILTTKPTSHVFRTFVFPESLDSHGRAISTTSQIMRWRNLEWSPGLYDLIMELKDMFPFKLLTEETWYVPLFNLDAWVKSGKPGDGSSFHVKISNITSLIDISTKEAEYLQTNLINLLDVAWTQVTKTGYDPLKELPKTRLIRMLDAIRLNNTAEIERINQEVKRMSNLSFIIDYNNPVKPEDESEEEEIFVELSKMKYLSFKGNESD